MRDLSSKHTLLFSFLPPTLTQFSFGNHILDKAGRNSEHVRLKSALGGRFKAPGPDFDSCEAGRNPDQSSTILGTGVVRVRLPPKRVTVAADSTA
jgi:hypothetical protein